MVIFAHKRPHDPLFALDNTKSKINSTIDEERERTAANLEAFPSVAPHVPPDQDTETLKIAREL